MGSGTLSNAQIHFINEPIKLIHIPLSLYGKYVQSLLQTLYPPSIQTSRDDLAGASHLSPSRVSWMNRHEFLNLSITPDECSLFCSKSFASRYFEHLVKANANSTKNSTAASISVEDFIVISVEGEGLLAGQRVLELTTPLAMAGISLFFITTYFSDYVLVPARSRRKVIQALEARGFAFDHNGGASEKGGEGHQRMISSSNSLDQLSRFSLLPKSPPPSSPWELQARTIALLKKHNIVPTVHHELQLHHCAASSSSTNSSALQIGLVSCLAHPPSFLSLTLTSTEAASLILEESTRARFEEHVESIEPVLIGSRDVLVPVTLNLEALGESATGIVCGVAGKLLSSELDNSEGIEMSYLSTARGAAVLLDESMVEKARERLKEGKGGLDVE